MSAAKTLPSLTLKSSAPPATSLIPRTTVTTTKIAPTQPQPSKAKKEDVRSRCTVCQSEFREETLKRNNGICGRCVGKQGKPSKSSAKTTRSACLGCQREFTLATLNKHQGRCARCHQKQEMTDDEAGHCLKCTKSVNSKTYRQYSGLCHPCVLAYIKSKFEDVLKQRALEAQPDDMSPLSRLQDPSSVDRSAPSLLSAQP